MHSLIIPTLAAVATGSTLVMAVAGWLRLKRVDNASITVVHKQSGKIATLPRNYSPAAVQQLLDLTA